MEIWRLFYLKRVGPETTRHATIQKERAAIPAEWLPSSGMMEFASIPIGAALWMDEAQREWMERGRVRIGAESPLLIRLIEWRHVNSIIV